MRRCVQMDPSESEQMIIEASQSFDLQQVLEKYFMDEITEANAGMWLDTWKVNFQPHGEWSQSS